MADAVIVSTARTPIGKAFRGVFNDTHGADMGAHVISQLWGVVVTLVWSGIVAAIAFKLVDLTIGLRVNEEQEREGLDTVSHGERAYNG